MNKKEKSTRKLFGENKSNPEAWNLNRTIIEFTLPRLRDFRRDTIGYPGEYFSSLRAWKDCITTMITFMEDYLSYKIDYEEARNDIGYQNFCKYFFNLWW